jgi:hypothetical protein
MLTKSQQNTFDKIWKGELKPKKKGDFYYRMSKILAKSLDELETTSFLLSEIPKSYQSPEKFDVIKAAIRAMKLTEELVERLDPAFISPKMKDENRNENDCQYPRKDDKHRQRVGSRIIRRYKVDAKNYLRGLADGIATIRVSYEPSKEEIDFLNHLNNHQSKIDGIREKSERNSQVFSYKEFTEYTLPQLKKRGKNLEVKLEYASGIPKNDVSSRKTSEKIKKIEEIVVKSLNMSSPQRSH